MFCEQQFQKLTRYQRRRHKEEPSVAAAMQLKAGSDEQILAFEKIRLTGDYHHNCNVLAVGEGELIVVRKPSKPTPQAKNFALSPLPRFFQKRRALAALPRRPAQSRHRRQKLEESSGWGKASLADVFRLQCRRRCTPIQKCYLINEKRHHLMRCSPGPINYKLRGSHPWKSWH